MSDKTAFITGASRGIGRAIASRLALEGYELFLLCHRNIRDLDDLPGHHFAGDVGDFSFIEEVALSIPAVDVLINNAGVSWIGLLQDMSPPQWHSVINTNLTSLYNTCHAFIPAMIRRHSGHILNISSVWGHKGASMEVAYSASKGGMDAFTKALARELAPSGIQVNAIACGAIDTDMNSFLSEEDKSSLIDEIPSCRLGTPEDVAWTVSSVLHSSPYLTGQIISLDGGWQ